MQVGIGARANTELFASQLDLALGGIKVCIILCGGGVGTGSQMRPLLGGAKGVKAVPVPY